MVRKTKTLKAQKIIKQRVWDITRIKLACLGEKLNNFVPKDLLNLNDDDQNKL